MKKIKCAKSNITAEKLKELNTSGVSILGEEGFLRWGECLLRHLEVNQLYRKQREFDAGIMTEIIKLQLNCYELTNDLRFLNIVLKYMDLQKQIMSMSIINQVNDLMRQLAL